MGMPLFGAGSSNAKLGTRNVLMTLIYKGFRRTLLSTRRYKDTYRKNNLSLESNNEVKTVSGFITGIGFYFYFLFPNMANAHIR